MKRQQVWVSLATIVVIFFSIPSAGYAKGISKMDKAAFTIGAVFGDNTLLVAAHQSSSSSKLQKLRSAMTSLNIKDSVQQRVLTALSEAADGSSSGNVGMCLDYINKAKTILLDNVYKQHGRQTCNMFSLGLSAMAAMETTDQIELVYQLQPKTVDMIVKGGLTTFLNSLKDLLPMTKLDHETKVEIQAVLALFKDRVCTRNEAKIIRGHLLKLLKLYDLEPMTLLTIERNDIRATQQ